MPKRVEVPQDHKSIEKIADRLESCASALRAVAAMMEVQTLGVVVVPNYASLSLGIKNVEGFTNAARITVHNALEARGDFRATASSAEPKRKRA